MHTNAAVQRLFYLLPYVKLKDVLVVLFHCIPSAPMPAADPVSIHIFI
jgi:hypothetical protein